MKLFLKFGFLCSVLTLFSVQVLAQQIVENFDPVIRGYPIMRSIEVTSDDKVYLGGTINYVGQTEIDGLVRLNADLSLDESFLSGIPEEENGILSFISETASGGLIVKAGFELYLLNEDGSLDENFNVDSSLSSIYAIHLSEDQIIVCAYNGTENLILRINSDGTIDDSFAQTPINLSYIDLTIKEQSDGKILVAGLAGTDGDGVAGLLRLNADGTVDQAWDIGEGFSGHVRDIAIQKDGKVLAVGDFESMDGTECPDGLVRLNSDGSIDSEFVLGSTISVATRGLYGVDLLEDQKIMVVGRSYSSGEIETLLKLNTDGSLDDDFTPVVFNEFNFYGSLEVSVNSSDEIIVLGGFNQVGDEKRLGLAMISADGFTLNDADLAGRPMIKAVALQSDGKIIIGGEYHDINGEAASGVSRLNIDGTLDDSFNVDLDFSNPDEVDITVLEVLEDEKILVGGQISSAGLNKAGLIRLEADGSFDESFSVTTLAGYRGISNLYVDDDGKITLAGDFAVGSRKGIAQFNSDGSVYTSFNAELTIESSVYVNSAHFTDNDKIVVSGYDFNINQSGFSFRLSTDGSIDDTYDLGYDLKYVQLNSSFEIGEKLFIGGSGFGGGWIGRNIPILQANLDGGEVDDISFSIAHSEGSANTNGFVKLSDEEFIVFGRFEEFNGFSRSSMARVKDNGVVDAHFSFDIQGSIKDVVKLDDEHIFAAGSAGLLKIKISNDIPEILGLSSDFSAKEDEPIDIENVLLVTDDDDTFPDDFEITMSEGDHFTLDGNKIIPEENYFGEINTNITVSDGKDESESFDLTLNLAAVNDAPIIEGVNIEGPLQAETPLEINIEDLYVTDVDSTFPDDFILVVGEGDNYSVNENVITPDKGFTGDLSIPLVVNDGADDSPIYNLVIESVVITSAAKNKIENTFQVYPNPAANHLNVLFSNEITGSIEIEVFNLTGEIILNRTFFKHQREFATSISLNGVAPGMHLLKIKTPDFETTRTLIVK